MSENCSHNCSSCGETCASRTMESFRVPLNPQSSVKKVIGVVSGKGGVGKSLVTSLMHVRCVRETTALAFLMQILQDRRSRRHLAFTAW